MRRKELISFLECEEFIDNFSEMPKEKTSP